MTDKITEHFDEKQKRPKTHEEKGGVS
jgi:hypothetical protein